MWICPVCNGLETLNMTCPHCGAPLEDRGRLADYYNPYSPYREIDDLKMTDNVADEALHRCLHLLYCPRCNLQYHQPLDECFLP